MILGYTGPVKERLAHFELVRIGPAPHLALEHAGEGALVLFLHGIGGNRNNWRAQMQALADRFHVCAWDARGYGDSDDYDGPLEFADFSRDVERVLNHFRAAAAHLVGLSMGGFVAQDFYSRHPERVLSLVLADTRNGFKRPNAEEFLRKREAPLLAGRTPADIAVDVARSLAGPRASDEAFARLVASISGLHKESYLKTLRATTLIAEHPEYRDKEGFMVLSSVRVPTLVICGTEDTVTPPDMSREIAAGIPHARLQWIQGAGHLSNIEDPSAFNQALRAFLVA